MRTEICLLYLTFSTLRSSQNAYDEMRSRLVSASYPDVSLLMKLCAQRKAGRRQRARRRFACRLYPSHGPLRFITSHLFRARLCHAKNEAPEEEVRLVCKTQFIPQGLQKQSIKHALEKRRVFHRLWGNEREKVFSNYGKMNLWQSVRVLRSASIAEVELIKCSFC